MIHLKTKITEKEFKQLSNKELVDKVFYESYNNYFEVTKNMIEETYPIIADVYRKQSEQYENIIVQVATKIKVYSTLCNLKQAYESSCKSVIKEFECNLILSTIDVHWKNFLKMYNKIKEDISILSSYDKIDPLFIFRKDITEYYLELIQEIHNEVVTNLCHAQIPKTNPKNQSQNTPNVENANDEYQEKGDSVNEYEQ